MQCLQYQVSFPIWICSTFLTAPADWRGRVDFFRVCQTMEKVPGGGWVSGLGGRGENRDMRRTGCRPRGQKKSCPEEQLFPPMTRTAKMQGLESPSPALQGDDIIAGPVLSRTFSGPAVKKQFPLVAALVVVQRRRLQGVKGAAQRQPGALPLTPWRCRYCPGQAATTVRAPVRPCAPLGPQRGLRGGGD